MRFVFLLILLSACATTQTATTRPPGTLTAIETQALLEYADVAELTETVCNCLDNHVCNTPGHCLLERVHDAGIVESASWH